ncbi:MAG: hypothetical protein IPM48_04015 [Saprospiraceae bacterium]|nr:hypothetical protein [Saprospiraceae bacterium]
MMKFQNFLVFFLFVLQGCGLSSGELEVMSFRIADSTFQANTSVYFREADSLCTVLEQNQLNHWVDSLLAQRRIEVIELRK